MRTTRFANGCFCIAVLSVLLTAAAGQCQAPPPKPGDVMMEKYLALEAASSSQLEANKASSQP